MSTPTPGWYADPAGTPQLRWWDGNQWTDQYRSGDAPAANAASSAPAAAANAGPSAPTPHFTPVTSVQPRMTGGQITIAIVTSVLIFLFAAVTLGAAAVFSAEGKDLREAQNELEIAQQELKEAQEAAK